MNMIKHAHISSYRKKPFPKFDFYARYFHNYEEIQYSPVHVLIGPAIKI
jgi:hypothetical protein